MKTAISISDAQFESAEKLAAQLGLSRSELYQKALAEFINRHSGEKIIEKLNEIYAERHIDDIHEALLQLQAKSIPEEDW